MIDWEEVIKAESTEELKEIKLWLFQENMRLKQERSELEQERTELEQARNKFLDERVKLRDELDELNRRTIMERKRLKEENLVDNLCVPANGYGYAPTRYVPVARFRGCSRLRR